eukprot:2738427-Alexandrium_andersonii.AAC.1
MSPSPLGCNCVASHPPRCRPTGARTRRGLRATGASDTSCDAAASVAVSYTHLTLPTICSV